MSHYSSLLIRGDDGEDALFFDEIEQLHAWQKRNSRKVPAATEQGLREEYADIFTKPDLPPHVESMQSA